MQHIDKAVKVCDATMPPFILQPVTKNIKKKPRTKIVQGLYNKLCYYFFAAGAAFAGAAAALAGAAPLAGAAASSCFN